MTLTSGGPGRRPGSGKPQCSVCTHPERAAVDAALVGGESLARVAGRFSVAKSSLHRHKQRHLSPAIVEVSTAVDDGERPVLEHLRAQLRRLDGLLTASEAKARATTQSVAVIREIRLTLELVARLTGELDERSVVSVNLVASPDWLALRGVVLDALGAYPGAAEVVAGRLLQIEAGSGV